MNLDTNIPAYTLVASIQEPLPNKTIRNNSNNLNVAQPLKLEENKINLNTAEEDFQTLLNETCNHLLVNTPVSQNVEFDSQKYIITLTKKITRFWCLIFIREKIIVKVEKILDKSPSNPQIIDITKEIFGEKEATFSRRSGAKILVNKLKEMYSEKKVPQNALKSTTTNIPPTPTTTQPEKKILQKAKDVIAKHQEPIKPKPQNKDPQNHDMQQKPIAQDPKLFKNMQKPKEELKENVEAKHVPQKVEETKHVPPEIVETKHVSLVVPQKVEPKKTEPKLPDVKEKVKTNQELDDEFWDSMEEESFDSDSEEFLDLEKEFLEFNQKPQETTKK